MVLMVKNLPANAEDLRDSSSIPGSGRPFGGGNGNPLQCFCQENPMTEGPGGLQSMGLQSRKHDRNDLARRQACSKHQLRADVEGGDP